MLLLLPLDERPVNIRYPQAIAAIAGETLLTPPSALLPAIRTPADCEGLGAWLLERAPDASGIIVCLELLGYGGLIAARTTDDTILQVLARLDVLRELRARHPALPLYAFSVITRISNADHNFEEPLYWERYGTRLYRLSQLMHRQLRGEPVDAELVALRAAIPPELTRDFLARRHRNHTVNLAAVHMLADGVFDLLVLSSDDTSPYGLGTREKAWVAELAARLELGAEASGQSSIVNRQFLMYPGADEVGSALTARLIHAMRGVSPSIAVDYAVAAGALITAPYEDGPAQITVERQIAACGARLVAHDSDLLLAVNPPVPRRSEWDQAFADAEREERAADLRAQAARIAAAQTRGTPVIVGDIAYPNGADPAYLDALLEEVDITKLVAFGAWNTAGNTLGTAIAAGCAALLADNDAARAAVERFVAHHLIEGWGYQQVVRRSVRAWLLETRGVDDPSPADLAATTARVEAELTGWLASIPVIASRWSIAPSSVYLPWRRLFEVDFELVSVRSSG